MCCLLCTNKEMVNAKRKPWWSANQRETLIGQQREDQKQLPEDMNEFSLNLITFKKKLYCNSSFVILHTSV